MRNYFLIFSLFLFIFSCKNSDSPESSADEFLNGFFNYDFSKVYDHADAESKDYLNTIYKPICTSIDDSVKEMAHKVKIVIESKNITLINNLEAKVPFVLNNPNTFSFHHYLIMKKQDGKWLAQFTEDDMIVLRNEYSKQMQALMGLDPNADIESQNTNQNVNQSINVPSDSAAVEEGTENVIEEEKK